MHSGLRHGRDYTPLFKFLLSRVGGHWPEILKEARARLDSSEPIFWLVAPSDIERKALVRIGESSYFSGLYVDSEGRLALVDPTLKLEDLEPSCGCCTHTFNGKPFVKPFAG